MKKTWIVVGLALSLIKVGEAQLLIGGKAGGMGGAGVANVFDISAAYYNPAALMKSQKHTEIKISGGAEYTDPSVLSSVLAKANNVASFLLDNYANNLNFRGNADGLIGVSVKKVGISSVPLGNAVIAKSANTFVGSISVEGQHAATLTLGTTFSLPFLPADLDVGVNLKVLSAYTGDLVTTGTTLDASGARINGTGTGMGFDLGLLTTFDIPLVTDFMVGLAARNLSQGVTYSRISQLSYLDYSSGTPSITTEAAVTLPNRTTTADPSYVLGFSALIPDVRLNIAGDLELVGSNTNTHLGIEYPLFSNVLLLRGGVASGNNLSKTTIGAAIQYPKLALEFVGISDAQSRGASSYIVGIDFVL